MANARGAILTNRDRALLAFIGVARYVSAEQVHRLYFEGKSKKQTYRRLSKLCQPGGKPGEGPCLRRLEYRRSEGTGVPVWALAPYGRIVATRCYPFLRPPAAHDVGHQFLEHTLVLNDVLAGLVLKLRRSLVEPFAELPFLWLSEDDEALQFNWNPQGRISSEYFKAVLKPDAVIESRVRSIRLFLEAETGTQSITTATPGKSGAITNKVRRYARFVHGLKPGTMKTFYKVAFDDTFVPRLVFLVHSAERKASVEKVLKDEFGKNLDDEFNVFVFTFEEAPAALASRILGGRPQSTAVPERQRVVAVDEGKMAKLREAYIAVVTSHNVAVKAMAELAAAHGVRAPSLQVPSEAFSLLHDFVSREVRAEGPAAGTAKTNSR
jgi:hypothetical protein